MLTSCDAHVGPTLHILIHVFQLPANWLNVFMYNELYPPRNDTNKYYYVICNNSSISSIRNLKLKHNR